MSSLDALSVQYAVNERAKLLTALASLVDVYVVAGFDENDRVLARPLTSPDATPVAVPTVAGVRCDLGDEVLVQRVAGMWWITGVLTGGGPVPGLIHGEPIIVPPFIRDSTSLSNIWGTPNAVVDFASLRTTVAGLDPGITYLVTAEAEAYLSAAVGTTKVAMGVRIGFASDPGSIGAPAFGAGHTNTTPTLARARVERVVSGVTEIQITGRGYSSAVGSHTIGDGALYARLVPLVVAGRM